MPFFSVKLFARCFSVSRMKNIRFERILHEPLYLDKKPKIPEFDVLCLYLKGYDFPILESYSRYIHRMIRQYSNDVQSIAIPAQILKVSRFRPRSSTTEADFKLSIYERRIKFNNMKSTVLPIFLDRIQCYLPPGVSFSLKRPTEEEEELRYIPDLDLKDLYTQLENLELEYELETRYR